MLLSDSVWVLDFANSDSVLCASFHLFKFFFVLCKRSRVSPSTLKIARLLVNYGGFRCKTKAMSKSLLEFHGKLL